jgi:hypothetical protein
MEFRNDNGLHWVKIAPHNNVIHIKDYVFELPGWQGIERKTSYKPFDLRALCKAGAPNWPQTIETKGSIGKGDGPYVVDTIRCRKRILIRAGCVPVGWISSRMDIAPRSAHGAAMCGSSAGIDESSKR